MTNWHPISTAPTYQRVLVCNELWADTFGAVQIAERHENGRWQFDGEMNVENICAEDLDAGFSPDDFLPQGWLPLPVLEVEQ